MTKTILPFYEIKDQDYDLVYDSFVEVTRIILETKNSNEAILNLAFKIAWSDFCALKVLRENLGKEATDALIKFRTNHNAFNMVKAYCQKLVEEAQRKPVLYTQDGAPLINT